MNMNARNEPERTAKVLMLAGGLGTRLRPVTERVPKCLVPIGGRALIDYWFDLFAEAGLRDVLINTHHLREEVRRHLESYRASGDFRVEEAYEPELLGSAGTVHANRGYMDDADDCVVVYADNLSDVDLGELLAWHTERRHEFSMLLYRAPDPRSAGIAELDADGRIVSFVEKPAKPKSDLANGGVYVVSASLYREIADMNAFDLGADVLPRLANRMYGWFWRGYHRDIGTLEALREAETNGIQQLRKTARSRV